MKAIKIRRHAASFYGVFLMEDFRIKTGWRNHPKRAKLRRRLGDAGVVALIDLWAFCAEARPGGDLCGLDDEDIALAAGWHCGEPATFVATLVSLGWLEGEPGQYVLHDWAEHNTYVATHEGRSEKARKAANARWEKVRKAKQADEEARHASADASDAHASNASASSNAPFPLPIPLPSPILRSPAAPHHAHTQVAAPTTTTTTHNVASEVQASDPPTTSLAVVVVDEASMSAADVEGELRNRGAGPVRAKWYTPLRENAPYPRGLFESAWQDMAETCEREGSKHNAGLFLAKLFAAKQNPLQARASQGRMLGHIGRKDQALIRTVEHSLRQPTVPLDSRGALG